ncbi:hypothetical protein [Undibacterium curvum]|uniref:hypothetical protein n=1 Tax=Undibacterium curvum TaxID=2762294 RepID=UPI003D13267D
MSRERQQSELGEEVKCSKCGEFWPADAEFFYMNKGRPHSWCKACYRNDPKIIAKNQRFLDKASKQRQQEAAA